MPTENEIATIVETRGQINVLHFGEENERQVRKTLSRMRKQGIITIALADEPNVRRKVEMCEDKQIEEYAHSNLTSMKTQYFNTLVPIKKYIKDKKLLEMMGHLELIYEGVQDTLEEPYNGGAL